MDLCVNWRPPLIATEIAQLYLNNSDNPWKELCKDRERKPTLKMWSLDYFSGAGFSLAGNHKQQSKGAGNQLMPNLICLVKILLCSFHLATTSHFQAPIPLLANNPLDPLMFKGKEQFNSCLRSLLIWKSDFEEEFPHQAPLIIKNCTFKINWSASELSEEDKFCSAFFVIFFPPNYAVDILRNFIDIYTSEIILFSGSSCLGDLCGPKAGRGLGTTTWKLAD